MHVAVLMIDIVEQFFRDFFSSVEYATPFVMNNFD